MPRALALPEVEDAGRIPVLFRRLAPVAGRQGAVLLPRLPATLRSPVSIPRYAQEAHRRRFLLGPNGERELPPQSFDRTTSTLGLDCLAEFLIYRPYLRRVGGRVVADRGQPEQVARKLRTVGVQDERAPDPECAAESPASKTTLSRGDASPVWEASVVVQSSWAKTNAAKSTCWVSSTSRSRVDRPGLNVVVQGLHLGNVLEAACDRLEQFGLLA